MDIIDVMKKSDKSIVDKYSRPDVFAVSSKDLIDELAIARTSNLISQKTAIIKYLDYSEEEAMMEIEEIKKEALLVTPTNANNI
jgi:hypothetical protein